MSLILTKLLIIFVMIMSKKSESCQMVNMTCKCKKSSENEFKIRMSRVEPRLLSETLLDFNIK